MTDAQVQLIYRGDTWLAKRFVTPEAAAAFAVRAQRAAAEAGELTLMQDQTCAFTARNDEGRRVRTLGVMAAIADPIGRVGVWAGVIAQYRSTPAKAAACALGDPAVAVYWDPARARGGGRDLQRVARAAARVLHARTFGYSPEEHDVLLAEFATRKTRPLTRVLVQASVDTLAAASALYQVQRADVAVELIKLAAALEPAGERG